MNDNISNKQYLMFLYIKRHTKLQKILKKYKCDYIELQNMLPASSIDFSDTDITDNCDVLIRKQYIQLIDSRTNKLLAFVITSILALIGITLQCIQILKS